MKNLVVAIANQKGGTGKTATAAALAAAAIEAGEAVLLIDLDPQCNLTFSAGAMAGPGSLELLNGENPAGLIQNTAGGDIIPASWDLAAVSSTAGSARRLQEALKPLKKKYSLIIIDTPPTAGELQFNALQAANGLIIPVQADIYGVQSLYQIVPTMRLIQKTNRALKPLGVVITLYDGRSTLSRQMLEKITDIATAQGLPILGAVRKSVVMAEAAALQLPITKYAGKSKPAEDYRGIYKNLRTNTH